MRFWSEAVFFWLVDYYALTTIVLLAAGMALGMLRQPARRLSVAWSAVGGLAALALLAALPSWPRASWPPLLSRQQGDRVAAVATLGQDPRVATPLQSEPLPESEEMRQPAAQSGPLALAGEETGRGAVGAPAVISGPEWSNLAGWAFAAGGGLMLAWLAIGYWQTVAIRGRSRQAPAWSRDALAKLVGDGIAAPDLLVSEQLSQPVAVGLLHPSIILPDRLVEEEPSRRLQAVLAHEWAHIRNRDLWLITLSRLLMPILFAHPGYWWLRKKINDDQEVLADAAAAAGGRVDYAEFLLSWARGASQRPRFALAGSLALWESPSQLKKRIVMLLDCDFRVETTCPRFWQTLIRGGMALFVLALSVLTFRPSAVVAEGPDEFAPAKAGQKAPPEASKKSESGETVRVVDADGKHAPGASVYRTDTTFRSLDEDPAGTAVLLTRTGPDGSFLLASDDAKASLDRKNQVVVIAPGSGPAFVDPSVGDGMKLLRLSKDDVPIRGRLLDIQGQPVAGASVQLVGILWQPSGKLDEWLDALKTEKAAYPVQYRLLRWWSSRDVPSLFPVVLTDREGRFTLKGVGRERIASLLITGPKIETRFEYVATREMPTIKFPDFDRQNRGHDVTYHGAAFDMVAGPDLEIVGAVRDKDTGKPIAGAVVQTTAAFGNPLRFLRTTTDAEGHYRLTGVPPKTSFGDGQDVLAWVKQGPPYLQSTQSVGEGREPGPITRDFALKRGVLARGRVTDKTTGKPIQASFDYFILNGNPHLKDYPRYGTVRAGFPFHADENGEYRIVVMPGRGILGARLGNDTYRLGVGIDKIKDLKTVGPGMIAAVPHYLSLMNYNAVVEINPKPGDETITTDIQFDRGRTLKGTLTGPGGEPVSGALMMGAEDYFETWSHGPLPSAEFEVHALGSENQRGLLFYHEGKKLAAAFVVKPDVKGPVTVKLEPCGTLTGRLVANGLPQAEAEMTCDRPFGGEESRFEHGSLPFPIKTGKDGRFQVAGLVPGLKYSLRVWKGRMIAGEAAKGVIVKPGETKDLGDVKVGD